MITELPELFAEMLQLRRRPKIPLSEFGGFEQIQEYHQA
jgi:hypothetical protein